MSTADTEEAPLAARQLACAPFDARAPRTTVLLVRNLSASRVEGTLVCWCSTGSRLHEDTFRVPARAFAVMHLSAFEGLRGRCGAVTAVYAAPSGALELSSIVLDGARGARPVVRPARRVPGR